MVTPFSQSSFVPRPDLIDFDKLKDSNARHNLEHAFDVAERQLGIIPLLDPEGEPHPPLPAFAAAMRDALAVLEELSHRTSVGWPRSWASCGHREGQWPGQALLWACFSAPCWFPCLPGLFGDGLWIFLLFFFCNLWF